MAQKRLSRQESRLQTRERLLEAAVEVFSKRGFHDASVDDIAEEAGFSKGAVYSNFANKEELFLALLDRHLEAEWQNIASQFTPAGRQEDTEVTLQSRSFATYIEEKRTWNLLTLEFFLYSMRHPSAQQQLAERYRLGRNALTAMLRETLQVRDDRQDLSIEHIPWTLFALGLGLSLQAYLEPGAMPTDLYPTIIGRLLDGQLDS